MGHLRVTIGHPRVTVGHPRVTISHLRATMGHLRLTSIGYLKAVSLSLHHSHPCIIYEVNMRHIQDKYDAVMKQISIFFSKYEVLSTAIFKFCQNIIKLLFIDF